MCGRYAASRSPDDLIEEFEVDEDHLRAPGEPQPTPDYNMAPTLKIPIDPELFVRVIGGAMAAAGTLLAFGKLPRLSALVLSATIVPSTYTQYQFWTERDPATKRVQKQHFMKNLGLLGGALLASVDTEGRPGLAWRSRRAAKDAKRAAAQAKKDARHAAKAAKREASMAVHKAGDKVGV
jgi:uncharacterized membrane protein YphA (DoxX/SURF4 family)